jgi:hypothetical protein
MVALAEEIGVRRWDRCKRLGVRFLHQRLTHTSRSSGWCDRRRGLNVSVVPLNRPSAASRGFEEPNRVHTSQQLLSRPPTAHLPFLSAA